jgi:hypothetical protein
LKRLRVRWGEIDEVFGTIALNQQTDLCFS